MDNLIFSLVIFEHMPSCVTVYSYSQGPPVWRCEDGYPGHGDTTAQYGTPPYSVLASTTRYVPQQQVSSE